MDATLILINPWIYDFAAYDLWAKPLGLLYLAGELREKGFNIHLIDCLDTHNPERKSSATLKKPLKRKYGTGKFWRQRVPSPAPLSRISRPYHRYGISTDVFINELQKPRKPEAILVTSLMTYWYPGVFEAIRLAKKAHPNVPVILGGIYATLCPEHARAYSGADFVIPSPGQLRPSNLNICMNNLITNFPVEKKVQHFLPYPSFDLLTYTKYICILSTCGCPFSCAYCASPYLSPPFFKRDPLELFEEVKFWHRRYNIVDFAFYDDALLVDAKAHICIFLEEVLKNNLALRFHCPNGLHVAFLDRDTARLLYKSGFKTLRLGLETSDDFLRHRLGEKYSPGDSERAVAHLKSAGFESDQIGAYILAGLPGQSWEQVAETIRYTEKIGVPPYISEYSPIPHTGLWKDAVSSSRFDIESEPLFHNNSLLPCWSENELQNVKKLKQMVKDARKRLRKK